MDEAIAHLRKAIELEEKEKVPNVFRMRGWQLDLSDVLAATGRLDEAIMYGMKGEKLHEYYNGAAEYLMEAGIPDPCPCYRNEKNQSDHSACVVYLMKAVERDPGNADLHIRLGTALKRQKLAYGGGLGEFV